MPDLRPRPSAVARLPPFTLAVCIAVFIAPSVLRDLGLGVQAIIAMMKEEVDQPRRKKGWSPFWRQGFQALHSAGPAAADAWPVVVKVARTSDEDQTVRDAVSTLFFILPSTRCALWRTLASRGLFAPDEGRCPPVRAPKDATDSVDALLTGVEEHREQVIADAALRPTW